MTVLEKKAGSGVERANLGQHIVVAVVAGAIGIGAALGISSVVGGTEAFGPAQIEQARAVEFADYLENAYIARVNSAKNADLIQLYRGPFMARVGEIEAQRAADLVEHQANLHRGRLAAINAQRANDMVEFRYGGAGK